MITVKVNGESIPVVQDRLSHLMEHLLLESRKGIAVSVNEEIIPRTGWHEHVLQTGDNILIISATQGG